MPRREAVAKAATPNPRPANWLLAVPVFGSFLPFERPGPAGCWAGACEWFNALEIEALSDKLAEVLALLLKLVLTDTDSLTLVLNDALADAESFPPALLAELEALIEAEMLLLKLVESDTDALVDAEALLLALVLADSDALIEAEMLLLKLVDAEAEALRDADALLLTLVLAELEALIEAEMLLLKLVLTDAESLADAFATLAEAD